MQDFPLSMGLPGKALLKPFQGLFGPLENQSRGTSCFFGQVGQPHRVFQIPRTILAFSSTVHRFFFSVSAAFSLSMNTFLPGKGLDR